MRKFKYVILAAILVTCAAVSVACAGNGSPQAAFNTAVNGITACYKNGFKDKDCETYASAFGAKDSADYNAALADTKDMKAMTADVQAGDNLGMQISSMKASVKGLKVSIDGDTAKTTAGTMHSEVTMTFGGQTSTVKTDVDLSKSDSQITFHKTDGKWYVDADSFGGDIGSGG